MPRRKSTDILNIDLPGTSIKARAVRAFAPVIQHILGLELLNRRQEYCGLAPDPQSYMRRVFETFRVHWSVTPQELARIPKTGPLIVVANHPLGAMEGLVLANLLLRVRPDAKLMVNYLLGLIPNLRDLFFFVDPFGGSRATAGSLAGMKQSIRHLREGGALGIFPSGEVSSFNWKTRSITDPPWNPIVARMARMTGAPVLPIFFEGRNTLLFQALGLIHPKLRTMWLAREMIARSGQRIGLRVGSVIPARRLAEFETDEKMIEFLRHRTYLLKHRPVAKKRRKRRRRRFIRIPLSTLRRRAQARRPDRIIDAVPPDQLARDVDSLRPEQLLTANDTMNVYWAESAQIPSVLREIGRLREQTFRATGEGTGKSIDLDRYDHYYHHLVVWNPEKREVVASYRMGRTDEIIDKMGLEGLYTTTLFMYDEALLNRISPAIELGRSFVRQEYQRTFAPLLLMWRGLCVYLARFPRYRYLYGPVSISNTYHTVSKALMIQFLRQHHTPQMLADLVSPRHPFKPSRKIRKMNPADGYALFETDDLTDLVADLEPDQKGIPVLLRQYLKLGAKLLAFNVDPDFGDCVDGLIVVDLMHDGVSKYFTREDRASYLAYHGMSQKLARGA